MKKWFVLAPVVLTLVIAAACETQKVPAEQAMQAAESAWSAVSAEAAKLVPDQAKGVNDALAAAKAAFAKGDYAEALKGASPLPGKIAEVQSAIAGKKTEFTSAWGVAETAVTGMVTAIKANFDSLDKTKKLPKGIDKATFAAAKTTLGSFEGTMADAKKMFESGDYSAAIEKANGVKTEAMKLVDTFKITLPTADGAMKTVTDAVKSLM